jgi:uncharacterized LabA/DUF88 family protein
MKTVGVFVDIVDQFRGVNKNFKGQKIDYSKYLQRALEAGEGELYRAFAYGVQIDKEATGFILCLRSYGFEPKYKKAKIIDDRPNIQATNWNLGIAVDTARLIERLDVVVLGSSDPELIPVIEFLKERGIKVIVFSSSIPPEMREASNIFIEISDDVFEKRLVESSS